MPITLGALAGILCERSGVINIAIEGMLLAGAFTGAVGASLTNLWFGTIIAILTWHVAGVDTCSVLYQSIALIK